jgi:hypothetical protein
MYPHTNRELSPPVDNPHRAETALKNTAPFNWTPLRIGGNASIRSFGLSANFPGLSVKRFASASRPSKSWRRSGIAAGAKALHN